MAGYLRHVVERANSETSKALKSPGIKILVWGVVAAALLAVFGFSVFAQNFVAAAALLGAIVLIAPIAWLVNAVRATELIWRDNQRRIAELEEEIAPRFVINYEPEDCFIQRAYGSSVTTNSGSIQSNILGRNTIVRFRCTNTGGRTLSNCIAYLVDIRRLDNGVTKAIGFTDSVRLIWSSVGDGEEPVVELQPGVDRYVEVIRQRGSQGRPLAVRAGNPIEYLHLIQESGTYRFTVQVSGPDMTAERASINIKWDEEGKSLTVEKFEGDTSNTAMV